jgi:hypothetical protein
MLRPPPAGNEEDLTAAGLSARTTAADTQVNNFAGGELRTNRRSDNVRRPAVMIGDLVVVTALPAAPDGPL